MALKQFGNQNYVFGFTDASAAAIAAAIGLTPQEGTMTEEPEVEAEGKDIYNRTVAYVTDTTGKKPFNLSGYVSNSALFTAAKGQTFSYDGSNFIVRQREFGVKKDDFRMGSVVAVAFANVSDASGTTIVA